VLEGARSSRNETSKPQPSCNVFEQRELGHETTLASLIEEKGWSAFRSEEIRVLRAILSGYGGQPTRTKSMKSGNASQQHQGAYLVVSTGGGIVETPEVTCDVLLNVQNDSVVKRELQGRDLLKLAKSSGSTVWQCCPFFFLKRMLFLSVRAIFHLPHFVAVCFRRVRMIT
jgi:hypothetical protein